MIFTEKSASVEAFSVASATIISNCSLQGVQFRLTRRLRGKRRSKFNRRSKRKVIDTLRQLLCPFRKGRGRVLAFGRDKAGFLQTEDFKTNVKYRASPYGSCQPIFTLQLSVFCLLKRPEVAPPYLRCSFALPSLVGAKKRQSQGRPAGVLWRASDEVSKC